MSKEALLFNQTTQFQKVILHLHLLCIYFFRNQPGDLYNVCHQDWNQNIINNIQFECEPRFTDIVLIVIDGTYAIVIAINP